MKLHINGDTIEVPESIQTIADLLKHFQLDQKVVVVELNANILGKHAHAQTRVSDGDKVEIVHFVGGG
jgi:sulfur carrier protein